MNYKLRTGCYFYQIGEKVYLRNVDLCKDFLFDGIAYDILALLDGSDGVSEEALANEISELYQVPAEVVRQDVSAFMMQLSEQGLLEADEGSGVKPTQDTQLTSDMQPTQVTQPLLNKGVQVQATSEEKMVSDEEEASDARLSRSVADIRSVSIADQILGACMAENQLFSASVELTYRCNEHCVHCYVDDTAEKKAAGGTHKATENKCAKTRVKRDPDCMNLELSCEEWKVVFAQLRELGCVKILLTGGEVLLRDDFLAIVSSACKLGLLTDIYTNGYLLTQEMLDKLHRMKINSLSFSLYGGTADVHDAITGVRGSFDRTLHAIWMTKNTGIDTYIKTVVFNQNADDMEPLLQIGKSLQVDVMPSYTILDTHGGKDNAKYRVTNIRKLQKVKGMFRQYEPRLFKAGNKSPNDPMCSIGKSSLHINPYGDIMPCMTVPMTLGNIRKDANLDMSVDKLLFEIKERIQK